MVKMESLKVAFVHPDLGIGGAERLVLDVAVSLANQGVTVQFITNHFDKSHAFEELKSGKYNIRVIGDWLPRQFLGVFQALCAYIRMLYLAFIYTFFIHRFEQPSVYFVDQIPMAVPLLKLTGKPVIYYCHHPDLLASPQGGFLKRMYRKPIDYIEMLGTKKADVILVNSLYTQEVFRRTFPEITANVTVLYPTIAESFIGDLNKSKPTAIHKLVPEITESKGDDVVFLSINRFHPAKKLELAINALDVLRHDLSNKDWCRIHLIVAGGYDPQSQINDAYFKQLIELTHAKDLIIKITFLKSPSDKLKADLLKSCDALIYTPTDEHFGIVPLEAMAAAKPVIACNSGGPRETVEHSKTGYLCEPTPASLAEHMKLLLDTTRRNNFGAEGLKRLNNKFCYDMFAKSCMNIIDKTYLKQKL